MWCLQGKDLQLLDSARKDRQQVDGDPWKVTWSDTHRIELDFPLERYHTILPTKWRAT
jgi:hypothetical protein